MRISVFPKGDLDAIMVHRTKTAAEWIREMSTLPIEGVELYAPMLEVPGVLDEVKAALAETGLAAPMLCASPDFAHPDAAVRAAEIERHARTMRVTREIGGAGASCRVLSGQRHPGVLEAQGMAWVVEAFNTLLPLARELDIVLGFENHYKDGYWEFPEFAQSREVYLAILEQIDDRVHFGVQFDPSNATVAGVDAVEFLTEVIDRVVTMQASDRSLLPGATLEDLKAADGAKGYASVLQHGAIGDGIHDYPGIFTTLVEHGYDGWISIEDGVHGFDEMARSVDFLVEARSRYFGGSTAVRVAAHEAAKAGEDN